MICPFCQAALDPVAMSCPRCGAAYPASGGVLGLRLRSVAIAFVLLVITSLVMVDCVLHHLPGHALSPDMKSSDVRRTLMMLQTHQQPTQNESPPPPRH